MLPNCEIRSYVTWMLAVLKSARLACSASPVSLLDAYHVHAPLSVNLCFPLVLMSDIYLNPPPVLTLLVIAYPLLIHIRCPDSLIIRPRPGGAAIK